ncbi:unnamed protein product [Gadus morhua 'NCC']
MLFTLIILWKLSLRTSISRAATPAPLCAVLFDSIQFEGLLPNELGLSGSPAAKHKVSQEERGEAEAGGEEDGGMCCDPIEGALPYVPLAAPPCL